MNQFKIKTKKRLIFGDSCVTTMADDEVEQVGCVVER